MLRSLFFAASTLVAVQACAPAVAQAQYLPPRGIPGGDRDMYEPAQGQDAAGLSVRIDRLENQVRSLTGQLEQSQFQVKRLEDALRKFQQDVEFRFQESAGGRSAPAPRSPAAGAPGQSPRRSELNENGYPVIGQGGPPAPEVAELPPQQPSRPGGLRRGDAFDPSSDPGAPGAPRQLGTLSADASQPVGRSSGLYSGPLDPGPDPDAPLDLTHRAGPVGPRSAPPPIATSPGLPAPQIVTAPAGVPGAGRVAPEPPGAAVASLSPSNLRDEYELATTSLKDGQYEAAENAFRSFLQKHPKDRLAADATFYLGESFFRRSRPREAAEQYLKVSTDFSKSPRAPEALIKLGLSLEKLGAREQACAAYGEVGRKYPGASASLRGTADRESKRAQC